MNKYDFLYCITHPKCFVNLNLSFSQEGEDMIIDELLEYRKNGFYVDLGAHHPIHLSNTHKFYVRGWRGLNVDAMPGSMESFRRYRERDINIEAGISDTSGNLTFYEFDEPAVNTLDDSEAEEKIKKGYTLIKKENIKVYNVMELLDKYVPLDVSIDMMDIDIEGLDVRIVAAIDWDKYHPSIVMIEKSEEDRKSAHATNEVLVNAGYELVASTSRTAIYRTNQ